MNMGNNLEIFIGCSVIMCALVAIGVLLYILWKDSHWKCPLCGGKTKEKEFANGDIVRICEDCHHYFVIDNERRLLDKSIKSSLTKD